MLFCDLDLAARIERAEARLLLDACTNVARRLEGVLAEPIGGGVAAYTEPGSPLNKVCGLGFADNFDEQAFEALEREHARRGVGLQVELATLADPKIARWLTSRGFELVGVENVLGRDLSGFTANAAFPDVRIARSELHELDLWLDVVVTGFAAPDTQGVAAHQEFGREVLERVIRDFAQAERVVRYLARIDDRPAGGGTMRTFDGIAQLCGASTLPALRRRGVQSALLERRLAEAARDGCSVAVVTTQPGSKSQQNVQRHGFELLYARNVLVREAR